MDWILPIAGIIAAVAFLVICVVLALFLMQLLKTVKGINETLDGIQGQIQGITRESTDLLHKANRLTEDIQDKSLRLNSVVDAVKGVGDSVQTLNTSVDRVTNSITHNISQNEDKISQVIQWSNVAMEVADKWQLRRDRRSNVSSYKSDINSSNDFETQVPKNYNEKSINISSPSPKSVE
ncbi:DUF948 domain-containing protein [Mammaliicoccus fleurettii]|nr:DUF948 domain-containing protein [Mammaliicoccus fleurettii]